MAREKLGDLYPFVTNCRGLGAGPKHGALTPQELGEVKATSKSETLKDQAALSKRQSCVGDPSGMTEVAYYPRRPTSLFRPAGEVDIGALCLSEGCQHRIR